jgi:hypothetical protein
MAVLRDVRRHGHLHPHTLADLAELEWFIGRSTTTAPQVREVFADRLESVWDDRALRDAQWRCDDAQNQ